MEPDTERKIPAWGWYLNVCCLALGVGELLVGNYFWAVVLIGAGPFGFALRLYKRRRGAQPPTDAPADVESWLLRWTFGYGVCAAGLLGYGGLAMPNGIPLMVMGMFPAYLAVRLAQDRRAVRELDNLSEREGLGSLVVLVGRQRGLLGLARRGWVIGVNDTRLAIAQASLRQAEWETRPLAEVTRFEAHLKRAMGDLHYSDGARDLHLTAILARPLVTAEGLVATARR